jgi:hypothetical protein
VVGPRGDEVVAPAGADVVDRNGVDVDVAVEVDVVPGDDDDVDVDAPEPVVVVTRAAEVGGAAVVWLVAGAVCAVAGLAAEAGRTRMYVTRAALKTTAVITVERRTRPWVTSTAPRCRLRGPRSA